MDFSALLKPEALTTTYLTYSSYKTPNFRPTDRPTDFGREGATATPTPNADPSRHGNDLHNLNMDQFSRTQFPGSREIIRQRSTTRDSLLSALPDWREAGKDSRNSV